ncbi:MAG: hypothetical protein KDD82_10895 [Planctomycetes bacterium]|nr:hypothetical protein [Planctomycetota bacterium]
MIVSNRASTSSPRWLRACVLVGLGLLPLGGVQAQEPDYEAVGDRLLRAVEEGELSPEQAKAMMGALASQRFAERLAGEDGEDGEDAKWEELVERYEQLGLPPRRFKPMVGRLAEAGVEDEALQETLWVMLKLVRMLRGGELDKKTAQRFERHLLDEVELSGEQVELVWGEAKRLAGAAQAKGPSREALAAVKAKIWAAVEAGKLTEDEAQAKWEAYLATTRKGEPSLGEHYRKLGVDEQGMIRIKEALAKAEVDGEQLERVLAVIARVAYALESADAPEAMLEKVTQHLREGLGLNPDQVELVIGLARRVAAARQD